MVGFAHDLGTGLFHVSPGSPAPSDAEPVIVTPTSTRWEFGAPSVRDRAFATHCAFSWRSENVSVPSGDARRTLVFKRHKQTASFERTSPHDHVPRVGDRVTRAWDGATFEVSAVCTQSRRYLCDLVEAGGRVQ